MPNTQQALLSGSFVDADGVRSSVRAYALIDPTSTVTQAKAMLTDFLTAVVACSDAGLIGASLNIVDLSAPVGSTGVIGDASVDEIGTWDFNVPASGRNFGLPILALKDSLVVAGKIVTDTGPGADLATLLSAGETGITYTAQDFLALGALASTFRSDRKSKRALRQLSRNHIS